MLKAEKGPEERELITRSPNMETNNNSPSSTEKTHGPELSLAEVNQSSGNSLDCPVDARVRDHTNNRIGEASVFIENGGSRIQVWHKLDSPTKLDANLVNPCVPKCGECIAQPAKLSLR